jgi:hypothetical protein
MKTSRLKIILLLILLFSLIIPTSIAIANSLPPPYRVWFRFVSENEQPVNIKGLQVIGCEDEKCSSPQLLILFGQCTASECLKTQPNLEQDWTLDCAADRCLLQAKYPTENGLSKFFKLVVNSKSGIAVTTTVKTPEVNYGDSPFKIILDNSPAVIQIDTEFRTPRMEFQGFFTTYIFTILVELITAAILLSILKKGAELPLKPLVWTVVWANILCYPVAWLSIPSFSRFQANSSRSIGMIFFFVVVVLTLVSFWFARNRDKPKKGIIIASIFIVPICAVIVLVGVFMSTYGNYDIGLSGLGPVTVIILAELFAVSFEGFLLYQLPEKKISLLQAALVSLVMNAVSAILGYFMWW